MTATTKTGLTYKELQAALKELRANGYTLQVKLNAKEYDLRMEWVRLTAIIEREASKAQLQELCVALDIQVLKTEHVTADSSTFGDYCDLADRDNYIGCYAQCKLTNKPQPVDDDDDTYINPELCVPESCELADKDEYVCDMSNKPTGWDVVAPPTWVEWHVPRWLQASDYTKETPHHYVVEGMGVVFPHELTGQATELACECLIGDALPQELSSTASSFANTEVFLATNDFYKTSFTYQPPAKRPQDIVSPSSKRNPLVKPQPAKRTPPPAKPVNTQPKVKLEVPKADKSPLHTNYVHQRFLCAEFEAKKAAYMASLGQTERQALSNLTDGVKVAKGVVTSAARNIKAFGEGFISGLKAA